jgi:hypothetical protein
VFLEPEHLNVPPQCAKHVHQIYIFLELVEWSCEIVEQVEWNWFSKREVLQTPPKIDGRTYEEPVPYFNTR